MKNILIIDDERDFRFLLKRKLTESGFNCMEAGTKEKAFEILGTENVDLVLCDLNLKKESGKDVLIEVKEEFPTLPVIIITGYSNVRTAVDVMKLGAIDYLLKPLVTSELIYIINKRLTQGNAKVTPEPVKTPAVKMEKTAYVFSPNKFFQDTLKQIDLVAPTDYSVIIYGESGTGKEAFAQEIHKRSKRKNKPFLAIDCGALSKELSASILFGHEKGAFTGAIGEKEGAFEIAQGGTVFLDEVSNLPYEIQVSLLRVMQERKTRRVGGTKDIPIDIRIIVASNKKLWDSSRRGEFREDLYHRFNEFSIDVLPLRERKDDIAFYTDHFLKLSNAELGKQIKGFTDEAKELIMAYSWPGNLRELRNLVKRCVLITETDLIGVETLPADFYSDRGTGTPPANDRNIGSQYSVTSVEEQDYRDIIHSLKETGFDKRKTGQKLNMTLKTLNEKIKTFGDKNNFKLVF